MRGADAQVTSTVQDMTEHVNQSKSTSGAGTGGRPGGPTAAQGRWMGLRIGFMQRSRSHSTITTPRGPTEQLKPTEQSTSKEQLSAGNAVAIAAEHALAGAHDKSADMHERAEEAKGTWGDLAHGVSAADAEQAVRESKGGD